MKCMKEPRSPVSPLSASARSAREAWRVAARGRRVPRTRRALHEYINAGTRWATSTGHALQAAAGSASLSGPRRARHHLASGIAASGACTPQAAPPWAGGWRRPATRPTAAAGSRHSRPTQPPRDWPHATAAARLALCRLRQPIRGGARRRRRGICRPSLDVTEDDDRWGRPCGRRRHGSLGRADGRPWLVGCPWPAAAQAMGRAAPLGRKWTTTRPRRRHGCSQLWLLWPRRRGRRLGRRARGDRQPLLVRWRLRRRHAGRRRRRATLPPPLDDEQGRSAAAERPTPISPGRRRGGGGARGEVDVAGAAAADVIAAAAAARAGERTSISWIGARETSLIFDLLLIGVQVKGLHVAERRHGVRKEGAAASHVAARARACSLAGGRRTRAWQSRRDRECTASATRPSRPAPLVACTAF